MHFAYLTNCYILETCIATLLIQHTEALSLSARRRSRTARRTKLEHEALPFGSMRRDVPELRIFWTILLTDCSSHCCRCRRRRRNLAEGCNSRRGCFSATRIGRDGRGTRWTRRDGTKGIAESTRDECESSQPAAPPMAIPGGPPANCSCYKLRAVLPPMASDDERLRLPFSRISTIHTRHDLPVQVAVSNDHSRFPYDHPTLR